LVKRITMPLEDSSDDDLLTSSDEEIILNRRKTHEKIRGYVNNVVPYYDDIDFQSHFRFTREVVEKVLTEIRLKPVIVSPGRPPVQPLEAFLLTLWILGNQECFRSTADRFGFSRGHAHKIFIKTIKYVTSKKNKYIIWPVGQHLMKNVDNFNHLRGNNSFPNVVGCVDGTHIMIPGPRNDDSFYNRKGVNSMILQGICNSGMSFIDVYCGWPGSAHDARVWRNSPIYQNLRNNAIPTFYHLLGDSAYPLEEFIIVPFKDNGHLTAQQKRFNKILSSTRVVIEQAYGRLKGTWRRLKFLNIQNLTYFKYIVTAACILHNICVRENIRFEEDESYDDVDNDEPYNGNVPTSARNKRNLLMDSL
jgi:hypothetical protein